MAKKVVLGGGISGLSAAYYLLKTSQNTTLIEGSHRLGGWIKSSVNLDNSVFEQGPRTIRCRGEPAENTLSLVEELGLSDKILPIKRTHPAATNRMIYVNKELHLLPSSLTSLLVTKPPFSKPLISALFQDLKTPQQIANDESIYSFVERRLGKEIADYAVTALIRGICAGDAKEISVKFLMKSLFEAEQVHGSILKGMVKNAFKGGAYKNRNVSELLKKSQDEKWNIWSLKGGMEVLPQTLERAIRKKGGEILLNNPCKEISLENNKVIFKVGQITHEANHVISALPASKLATLVRTQHPQLSQELSAIPTVSVAVVNLQYKGKHLKNEAFGFLVPSSEKIPILGIIYDSCCFSNGDNTVLTVMMGGKWFKEYLGSCPTPESVLKIAIAQVGDILKITEQPEKHCVTIMRDCIPQYVLGHHDRVARIKSYLRKHNLPLSVVGASYDGVGINDVILSARRAVEKLQGTSI
uniref:Protoporphyrinogen oxidase n=1 Tax=Timema cristinae TaxID=61476 RepID=A0A7R9H373_TIMCR|nr:unnamed protein product [Timema cristinae]